MAPLRDPVPKVLHFFWKGFRTRACKDILSGFWKPPGGFQTVSKLFTTRVLETPFPNRFQMHIVVGFPNRFQTVYQALWRVSKPFPNRFQSFAKLPFPNRFQQTKLVWKPFNLVKFGNPLEPPWGFPKATKYIYIYTISFFN